MTCCYNIAHTHILEVEHNFSTGVLPRLCWVGMTGESAGILPAAPHDLHLLYHYKPWCAATKATSKGGGELQLYHKGSPLKLMNKLSEWKEYM